MQKHIKTVHLGIKDHHCTKCGARFAEKGNLTKHMKRHEGARVWKCSIPGCSKTFVLRDGLARHQKFVHGVQNPSALPRSPSVTKPVSGGGSKANIASRGALGGRAGSSKSGELRHMSYGNVGRARK